MAKANNTTPTQEPVAQMQLALPYEQITAVAGRTLLREVSEKLGRQTVYLNIDIITHRGELEMNKGFNPRFPAPGQSLEDWYKELQIAELAADLLENGQQEALEGDLVDTPEGPKFFLTEGFRRSLAIRYNISQGHTHYKPKNAKDEHRSLREVEVLQNPKEWTEEDRIARSLSTDNKMKFRPIETAMKLKMWRDVFGRTSQEIADKLGSKSRQWVDNQLALAEEPQSIRDAVESKKITPTAALTLKQNVQDPTKREEIVQKAVQSGEGLSIKQATDNKYLAYDDMMGAIVDQVTDEVITAEGGRTQIKELALKAIEVLPAASHENIRESEKEYLELLDDREKEPEAFAKTETKKSLQAEENSRKTDPNFKDPQPKGQKDALPQIDFSEDKAIGEMDLNEAIKLLDKLHKNIDSLPAHMQQYKSDWQGLCNVIQSKITNALEVIKKAPNTR